MIRQYPPKSIDLSGYIQEQLYTIAYQLNIRPRQRFNYRCPIEAIIDVVIVRINDARINSIGCCTQSLQALPLNKEIKYTFRNSSSLDIENFFIHLALLIKRITVYGFVGF